MKDKDFELYKNTIRKMSHIGRMHRSVFERRISQMGIHHSQHHILMYISRHGEISSQKDIAEKFGITPAAVARSLKSLEAEGFIERESKENDSRFNKIVITPKGAKIAEDSYKMFVETDQSVFEDFSEEDFEIFNSCLDKMSNALQKEIEECCKKVEVDE